jgi:hypothetical protein
LISGPISVIGLPRIVTAPMRSSAIWILLAAIVIPASCHREAAAWQAGPRGPHAVNLDTARLRHSQSSFQAGRT